MSGVVEVKFVWGLDEINQFLRSWYRYERKGGRAFVVLILIHAAFAAMAMIAAMKLQSASDRLLVNCVLLAPLIFELLLAFLILKPPSAEKLTLGHPEVDRPIRMEISRDGWKFESHLSRNEHQWGIVSRIVRMPDGFAVQLHGKTFRWLPLTAFASEGAVADFVQLVRDASVEYRDHTAA